MLIDFVVDFCHERYISHDCNQATCCHIGDCPGSCKQCLEEIHFPQYYPNGMGDYNCENLINFYVCDYSYKYASEMWYLYEKSQVFKSIRNYKIMSIGCGGCPDLMALESYIKNNSITDYNLEYCGIDINTKWIPVHETIKEYCNETEFADEVEFKYADAVQLFKDYYYEGYNILILQYVISHFYNTGQINEINLFFDNLIDSFVNHKTSGEPFIIFINDVNSCYRGRDLFGILIDKLKDHKHSGQMAQYYFDYRIKSDGQRYGYKHKNTLIRYNIPSKLDLYEPWRQCSSAQMLIEIN